ncbi:hypothetical protein LO762_26110 [Actinocorallia sp. API 0066]|uniref:hypothetical protein n=1 Tax=Actinocorallia sp. API 0066 TaxID=2896846 RepID=UPI001E4BA6C0|nr:hypothetical protein [Actinocorallia sp. API 0066]MCD0452630.1 hypothetical protein [Actinocorallia sp. API 0066]
MRGSKRKVVGAVGAVVVAVGLVASPVAAGYPGAGRCELAITEMSKGTYRVTNRCAPKNAADRATQIIVWGEDWPDLDDYLTSLPTSGLVTSFIVNGAVLNEDGASRDEVYLETRFQRPNNTYYTIKSNVIKRQFMPIF